MQNLDIDPNSPSEKCSYSLGDLPQPNFDHKTLGIWELYIEKHSPKSHLPFCPFVADKAQFSRDLQYLWRAVHDLSGPLLLARMAASAALALSPAASLW
jgi:hypothetical protein